MMTQNSDKKCEQIHMLCMDEVSTELVLNLNYYKITQIIGTVLAMPVDNKAMLMAYRCDGKCATDCCIYKWD